MTNKTVLGKPFDLDEVKKETYHTKQFHIVNKKEREVVIMLKKDFYFKRGNQ